jgi:hypothetical protein
VLGESHDGISTRDGSSIRLLQNRIEKSLTATQEIVAYFCRDGKGVEEKEAGQI